MKWLAFAGRNAMYIHSGQRRVKTWGKLDARFLQHLAPGCVKDGLIFGLDVASRQEPAFQPPVMDQQDRILLRM